MNFSSCRSFEAALLVLGSLSVATTAGCSAEQPVPAAATNGGASNVPSAGASGASLSGAGQTSATGGASSTGAGGTANATGGNPTSGATNGGTNASGNGGTNTGAGPAAGATAGSSGSNPGGGSQTAGTAGALSGGIANGGSSGSGGAAAGTAGRGGAGGSSAGAGGQAAGGSAGSLGCSPGKYLLCEDFESTAVGNTPQGWTRHGDQAAVSDDAAKRGSHALKLSPVASAERRIYHDAALLGAAHWGRIYYKVKQPVPDAFVHSTLVSFTGDAPQRGASEIRVIDTVKQAVDTRDVGSLHQYLYNVQVTGVNSEFSREGPYDQKFEDAWHCVEYHIDAATQSYDLYIDGKSEISFKDGAGNFSKSDIPTSFKQLRVGWVNYQQAAPGFTAWIDEIAFDDERIGCD